MESAHLIDLCRLMESQHHIDLHSSEPKFTSHHRLTGFPHLIALHREVRLPSALMIRLLLFHMESVPLVLMIRPHRIALLRPMGSAHLTVLPVAHPLIQLRLLMSLLQRIDLQLKSLVPCLIRLLLVEGFIPFHRMDLRHLIDPFRPCRHRTDLLHHAVNPLALRIGQHRLICPLHRMELARIVHHTLQLPLIQRRALTDRLIQTVSLHKGEHRLAQRHVVPAHPIPAPTTRLLLPPDQALLTVPLHLMDLHQRMKFRGLLLRIQLHLVDQLQRMRPVHRIDLLLLLMEQAHHVDLPQLMRLIHHDQLLPIQKRHSGLFQLLLMEQAHHVDLPPLMRLIHHDQLLPI